MNWLPSFAAWQFAVAGAIAAAGPIAIHLLNRRRFRVVEWAAMDFLREALQRNRRVMQLRDILLLLLRTAAVVLFGLALARPYFAYQQEEFDGLQSLHAVLLIDNSLSMSYETLEGTVLARTKQRAREFIDKLPKGSQVTVIPLCGSRFGSSPDPYPTKQYAEEAIDRIEVVDRAVTIPAALNAALDACQALPQLAKRVVLFTDQQSANWERVSETSFPAELPPLQIVEAVEGERPNTFVSEVQVQDHLADVETPATIIARIEHVGSEPRRNVQVRFEVDGEEVASQSISQLEPGSRELTFQHTFDGYAPQPGQPAFVPVAVSLPADRLPEDDRLTRVVPVVAALPVVFVDQYGADEEDPVRRKLGETRHLRRLLAPSRRDSGNSQLIKIRHLQLSGLSREVLADARLVVLAGLNRPDAGDNATIELLRQYVQQGGQLVVAAGGSAADGFDPEAWNNIAWKDGGGILPAPLESQLVGALPEQVERVEPFFLAYDSLDNHPYFRIAGTSEDELRGLYSEPLFFQAAHANLDQDVLQKLLDNETARLRELADFLSEYEARRTAYEQRGGAAADPSVESLLREDERRLAELQPNWLLWNSADDSWVTRLPEDPQTRENELRKLAEQSLPVAIGRFTNSKASPFLVERRLGKGRMLFVSSGVLAASQWNTLPQTNAFLIFDRILRTLIDSTLPQRNFVTSDSLNVPLPRESRDLRVELQRPGDEGPERLQPGFIGRDQFGVTVEAPLQRGTYRLVATRPGSQAQGEQDEVVWTLPLSISLTHDASATAEKESDLTPLALNRFDELAGNQAVFRVGPEQQISLAGAQIRGQDSWFYFVLAVLLALLAELVILAWPAIRTPPTPTSTTSTSTTPSSTTGPSTS